MCGPISCVIMNHQKYPLVVPAARHSIDKNIDSTYFPIKNNEPNASEKTRNKFTLGRLK